MNALRNLPSIFLAKIRKNQKQLVNWKPAAGNFNCIMGEDMFTMQDSISLRLKKLFLHILAPILRRGRHVSAAFEFEKIVIFTRIH